MVFGLGAGVDGVVDTIYEGVSMKFAAIIVASNLLLGVGTLTDDPLASVAQLGAVAALSYLAIWERCMGTPASQKAHKRERDEAWAKIEAMDNRHHQDSERLRETLDKMLAHCMSERQ